MSIKKLTLICALFTGASLTFGQTNWSAPVAITGNGMNPRIARDSSGGLAVCYLTPSIETSGSITTARHLDVYATFSTDAGNSWSNPTLLSDPSLYNYEPAITAAGPGEFHICWTSGDALSGFRFHTARTTDSGNSFTTATRLQSLNDIAQAFLSNSIENVAGKTIVFRTGYTYTPPFRKTFAYLDSQASIVSPWSTIQAQAPTTTSTITGSWAGAIDHAGSVVIASSILYIDRFSPGDDKLLCITRSIDSGESWASTILPTEGGYDIFGPTIHSAGNGTWVTIWSDFVNINFYGRMLASRSIDDGQSWSAPILISPVYTFPPTGSIGGLATDSSGRWIFLNSVGSYTYSSDNGITWSSLSYPTDTQLYVGRDLVYNGNGQWIAVMADVTGIKKSTLQWGASAVGNWELY